MNLIGYFKYIRALLFQGVNCRKLGSLPSNQGVFLTYHRILPSNVVTPCVEPGMYVTPSTLQTHILFLKKYFHIVTSSQAETMIERAQGGDNDKPHCVITFDDGWQDFYTYAWPILRKERVPAVVFLPTGLIGTTKMFWTDRLALILEKAGIQTIIAVQGSSAKWAPVVRATSFQQKLAEAIGILKQYSYQRIEELLNECAEKAGISQGFHGRTFMNWEEVRELSCSGLVSFGSHTVNHAILTTLSHNEVQVELEASKKKLIEQKLVKERIPFSYPNGNYNKKIAQLVEQNGYSSAVSCDPGWNGTGTGMFNLKRISLHQDISSTSSLLAYRLMQNC